MLNGIFGVLVKYTKKMKLKTKLNVRKIIFYNFMVFNAQVPK
jgi:hypothetical protein